MVSALTPVEACRFLVHLANLQGGPDNITAIVVRIGKPEAGAASVNGQPAKPTDVWEAQLRADHDETTFAQATGLSQEKAELELLAFLRAVQRRATNCKEQG